MTCHITPADYKNLAASQMSEKDLQEAVRQIALSLGWLVYHPFWSQRSESGFPDLVCLRGKRILVAELKRQNQSPRSSQEKWLKAFEEAGIPTYVWRPMDLISGRIHEVFEVQE